MTLRESIDWFGQHPEYLYVFLLGLPVFALMMHLSPKHSRESGLSAWVYSLLVHLTCIPGTLVAVLLGYALFFTHENLLDVNFFVYFGPIVSMILTLAILGRQIQFREVPGFHRLSGFIVLIAISFMLVLMVRKLFVGIIFLTSFKSLVILGIAIYLILNWAWFKLTHSKEAPVGTFSTYLKLRKG